jgi:hypothetical protein
MLPSTRCDADEQGVASSYNRLLYRRGDGLRSGPTTKHQERVSFADFVAMPAELPFGKQNLAGSLRNGAAHDLLASFLQTLAHLLYLVLTTSLAHGGTVSASDDKNALNSFQALQYLLKLLLFGDGHF